MVYGRETGQEKNPLSSKTSKKRVKRLGKNKKRSSETIKGVVLKKRCRRRAKTIGGRLDAEWMGSKKGWGEGGHRRGQGVRGGRSGREEEKYVAM